jgi:hypothetical protein
MITALALAALLMTSLMLVSLPWFGWGSGIDAAGKGMAMFFPVIFMSVRALCLGVAMILLAAAGDLAWTGLADGFAGTMGVLFIAATGGVSFIAVSLLAAAPPPAYSAAPAELAALAVPVMLIIWILAEAYRPADDAQLWAVRGLTLVVAISPLPFLAILLRARAAVARKCRAEIAAAEAKAEAFAAQLPPEAGFPDILAFLETVPDTAWQTRALVAQRAASIPNRPDVLMDMLRSHDRAVRIRAALYTTDVSVPPTPAYFAIAEAEISLIIDRLRARAAPDAELVREGHAAIRLAWPAIHRGDLKKAQMMALVGALESQDDGSGCHALVHDAQMLASYVTG